MKPRLFVLLCLLWSPVATVAQDSPSARQAVTRPYGGAYFAPTQAYKVTIQSERGVVLGLNIPQGVFLGVEYTMPQAPSADGYTFRGDVVLRTRRADELAATEFPVAPEIMVKSPVEVVLKNVVVVVEPLGKQQAGPQPK